MVMMHQGFCFAGFEFKQFLPCSERVARILKPSWRHDVVTCTYTLLDMYIKFIRFVCGLHCRLRLKKLREPRNFSGSANQRSVLGFIL